MPSQRNICTLLICMAFIKIHLPPLHVSVDASDIPRKKQQNTTHLENIRCLLKPGLTLLGTNISHEKSLLSGWFSFSLSVGHGFVPWRVVNVKQVCWKKTNGCWGGRIESPTWPTARWLHPSQGPWDVGFRMAVVDKVSDFFFFRSRIVSIYKEKGPYTLTFFDVCKIISYHKYYLYQYYLYIYIYISLDTKLCGYASPMCYCRGPLYHHSFDISITH